MQERQPSLPSDRRYRLQFVVMAICIFTFFFSAFRVGLVRGVHDTIVDHAWGRAQFAIGAAVTSMRHGGYGYTIASPVKTLLEYAGLTGDATILKSLGSTFPENLRNPVLINKAIETAADFKQPVSRDEHVSGNGGDDVGTVDFVRLSFLLFGYNLLSFYLTYFAILGVSLACAVVAFRKLTGALAVIVVCALSVPLVFASSLLRPDMDGILDPRFLSTLSVIPTAHIGLAMLTRQPWTRCNAGLVALQACILVLAYWIRLSALWTVLALLVLAAVLLM